MKIPIRPPNFLATFQNNAERALHIVELAQSEQEIDDTHFFHWEDLQYRTPPEGLSREEWWWALKFKRRVNYSKIPALCDQHGVAFGYSMPDRLLKALYGIDVASGVYVGIPSEMEAESRPASYEKHLLHSFEKESIASSQLEGAVTTRQIAQNMIRSGRKPRNKSEQMILNNFNAMRHIAASREEKLTMDFIFDIHARLTCDTLDDPTAVGRLRSAAELVCVEDARDGSVLFTPPPAAELRERMQELCAFANESVLHEKKFRHPVLRAILLHFWLSYTHPFVDGNGRTARALFYWAMLKQGFWLFEFLAISPFLVKAPAAYARAFLHTETDGSDVTYFILHQVDVIQKALDQLHQFIAKKSKDLADAKKEIRQLSSFNFRQQAAIVQALRNPQQELSVEGYRLICNVSRGTAWTDLVRLEEKGVFKREKQGRKIIFVPVDNLENHLSKITQAT